PESDLDILDLADSLYQQQKLRRVYYSGYVPISDDNRLPVLQSPPVQRENRLYQADWLMRFYGFKRQEIVDQQYPNLDMELDPKLAYALRHPSLFPIDVNTAPKEILLRIPGVGVKGVNRIIKSRRFGSLRREHLKKMGIVWKRAKYFLKTADRDYLELNWQPEKLRQRILWDQKPKAANQLSLFA
ncbi:MAG: radical SAM protein, partial [Bacteroidota bacterium]